MESPTPFRELPPPQAAGSETKPMVVGLIAVVGAELVASVQVTCLVFALWTTELITWLGRTWFGLFVPAVLLYCASHVRLFGRGIGTVIAAIVANLLGLSGLVLSVLYGDDDRDSFVSLRARVLIAGYFLSTLGSGIIRTTSRSLLIATTPPEKQWFVSAVASMAMSATTAIHMFIVQGAVFDAMDPELFARRPSEAAHRLMFCESAVGFLSCLMAGALFVDRRILTDAPLALTIDRGTVDEPIFKLAKPFMFGISGYFLLQMFSPCDFTFRLLDSLAYRGLGVFHVGALVGAAPFVLKAFQGKGGLILLQIIAAIFIAGLSVTDIDAASTVMYAFGGLGLGALRAGMFTFLGQAVTPDNTVEGVGKFLSFELIALAIAYGLGFITLTLAAYKAGTVCYAGLIVIAALMILWFPSSPETEIAQP